MDYTNVDPDLYEKMCIATETGVIEWRMDEDEAKIDVESAALYFESDYDYSIVIIAFLTMLVGTVKFALPDERLFLAAREQAMNHFKQVTAQKAELEKKKKQKEYEWAISKLVTLKEAIEGKLK